MRVRTGEQRFPGFAILIIALLGAALICSAYWPGVMIDDARWQYQQALDNAYENWHPPLMAWVWHQLTFLASGPGPMLLLQLFLYWVGFALIGWAAWARGVRAWRWRSLRPDFFRRHSRSLEASPRTP